MMFKKIVLTLGVIIAPIFGDAAAELDTGAKRIVEVMSNQETGIAAYNKNIHYAEALNLAQDLNTDAIAKFFGCKTLVGETFLRETISSPVGTRDRGTVLLARQNAIRTLVENSDLKAKVEALLEKARAHEDDIVSLFSDVFIGKTCPELQQLELMQQQKSPFYSLSKFFIMNRTAKTAGNYFSVLGLVASTYGLKILGETIYVLTKYGQEVPSKLLLVAAYLLLIDGVDVYTLADSYIKSSKKRSKLHALSQFSSVAEGLETVCKEYGIKNQFNISEIKGQKSIALINKLQHSRYKDKTTYFFSTAAVDTFLYRLYREENNLAQVYACIAELDAYNAIATKIIEGRDTDNKFCFVTFLEQDSPLLKVQNFWNVLIKNAIPNTLSESRKIILTGPNAGGKTTAIRALLQNLILGQSYGVAAAESFEFTPFDVIHSYLNISDDILKGQSLFVSEVKRAQDVLQRIKTLDPQVKYFFALDELFTGTAAEDGEACAYEFIKKIAEFNDIQFVYATHFNKLKKLEEEGAGCVNYKVDAPTKDANGALVYPYTLSQGANQANVALDIARAANLFA